MACWCKIDSVCQLSAIFLVRTASSHRWRHYLQLASSSIEIKTVFLLWKKSTTNVLTFAKEKGENYGRALALEATFFAFLSLRPAAQWLSRLLWHYSAFLYLLIVTLSGRSWLAGVLFAGHWALRIIAPSRVPSLMCVELTETERWLHYRSIWWTHKQSLAN